MIDGIRKNDNFHCISLHLYKCIDIIKTKNTFVLNENEIKQLNKNVS